VFLRTRVIVGELTLDDEQRIILETKDWIRTQAETVPAYRDYLAKWGDWKNPWKANEPAPPANDHGSQS
jgi:hypothetical protein